MKPQDKVLYRFLGSLCLLGASIALYRVTINPDSVAAFLSLVAGIFVGAILWYRSLQPASDKAKGQRLSRETRRRLEEGMQEDEKPKREE